MSEGRCPVRSKKPNTEGENEQSRCPVSSNTRDSCGSVQLNPRNNMPVSLAAEARTPEQRMELDQTRVKSTIPMAGKSDDTVWEYPSPQMFWNALVRKNKKGDTQEEDMDVVVAIHNNMNENTWREVLAWEAIHAPPVIPGEEKGNHTVATEPRAGPSLLRFTGRPDETSPKSWLKQTFLGCPPTFDRHDWVVDRRGQEVRYVIDYYHDDQGVDADGVPGLSDVDTIQSIRIDVRPALDSIDAVLDRLFRMPLRRLQGLTSFSPLPLQYPRPASAKPQQEQPIFPVAAQFEAQFERMDSKRLMELRRRLEEMCSGCKKRLDSCDNESDRSNAAMAMSFCIGQVVCPQEASALELAISVEKTSEADLQNAFDLMRSCISGFEQRAMKIVLESAELGKNNK